MKIILIEDVKKQGKKGSVLEVKDGFGNFLINAGSAVLATSNSVNRLNRENEEKKLQEEKHIKECEIVKKKLENMKISFKVKTGDKDKVFGSISPKQIVEELGNHGFNIDKKQIKLTTSMSSIGFHDVCIELHKKVVATLKIELKK